MSTEVILQELAQAGVRLGLSRMRAFLDHLGGPDHRYPILHVGGTNGKGSACRMLAAILGAQGQRVGLHTSPHLQVVNERIIVDGRPVGDVDLDGLVARLDAARALWAKQALPADEPFPLTYFEFTVACAFQHFADRAVDSAVFEVGMGGRLDATNVCTPVSTAIVSIGLDHCDELGRDHAAIAGEKGGIIKSGVPVVVGPLPAAALQVIRTIAAERGAPISVFGEDYEAFGAAGSFRYRGRRELGGLVLGLVGDHQVLNAAVALRTLEASGIEVTEEALREGLARARNPGRLEWLAPDLLVDGAHNPDGANTLAAYLSRLPHDRKRTLLLGSGTDKDVRGVATALAPHVDRVYTTACDHPKARSPWSVAAELEGLSVPVSPAGPLADALSACRNGRDLVIVAGSLYLVGAVRSLLGAEVG